MKTKWARNRVLKPQTVVPAMRFFPLLTATLVTLGLFLIVFERDAVLSFAGAGEAVAATTEDGQDSRNQSAGTETAQSSGHKPVQVVVLRSSAQAVDSGVILRGRTEAARQVQVRSETSGLVISQPLRKGQSVTAGQVLCQLDPGTRNAALQEARARLTEAEVNASAAENLSSRGFASETQVVSRKAALESAHAAVERAQKEIEHLTMHAPFDGVLETDTAELGLLLQPGAPCATVIQLDPMKLVGFAPENEIDKIKVGAPAGGRLANGSVARGQVTFLARSADPLTRTFRVEVTVDNSDLSIRDGGTAEILIAFAGEKAHLLPSSALTLNNDGVLGVRTVVDDHAKFAPVKILRDTARGVWLAGLPAKVDVIVVGQEYVSDGRAVDPTYQEN